MTAPTSRVLPGGVRHAQVFPPCRVSTSLDVNSSSRAPLRGTQRPTFVATGPLAAAAALGSSSSAVCATSPVRQYTREPTAARPDAVASVLSLTVRPSVKRAVTPS